MLNKLNGHKLCQMIPFILLPAAFPVCVLLRVHPSFEGPARQDIYVLFDVPLPVTDILNELAGQQRKPSRVVDERSEEVVQKYIVSPSP